MQTGVDVSVDSVVYNVVGGLNDIVEVTGDTVV